MRATLDSARRAGQCPSNSAAHARARAGSTAASPILARICSGAAASPRNNTCCANNAWIVTAASVVDEPNNASPTPSMASANVASTAPACSGLLAASRLASNAGRLAASRSHGAGSRCNTNPSGCRRLPCDQPCNSSAHHPSFASPGSGSWATVAPAPVSHPFVQQLLLQCEPCHRHLAPWQRDEYLDHVPLRPASAPLVEETIERQLLAHARSGHTAMSSSTCGDSIIASPCHAMGSSPSRR